MHRKVSQTAPNPVAVLLLRGLFFAGLLAAWQYIGTVSGGHFFPTASATIRSIAVIVADGTTWQLLGDTNLALLIGFPLSAAGGLAIGAFLGRARWMDRLAGFYLDIAMVVPIIAVVPIIVVAFGLSLSAKVAVVVLFTFPVIAIQFRSALQSVDPDRVEMVRAFGASRPQVWSTAILPGTLPTAFAGLRIGMSRAVSGMIVVELSLVPTGIGGMFVNYRSRFEAANLYAVTSLVLLEGVVLAWVMRRIERRLPSEAVQ